MPFTTWPFVGFLAFTHLACAQLRQALPLPLYIAISSLLSNQQRLSPGLQLYFLRSALLTCFPLPLSAARSFPTSPHPSCLPAINCCFRMTWCCLIRRENLWCHAPQPLFWLESCITGHLGLGSEAGGIWRVAVRVAGFWRVPCGGCQPGGGQAYSSNPYGVGAVKTREN